MGKATGKGRTPDVLWVDASDPDCLIDFAVRSQLLIRFGTLRGAASVLNRDDSNGATKHLTNDLENLDLSLIRRIEDAIDGPGRSQAVPLSTFAQSLHLQSHALRRHRGRPARFRIRRWIETHDDDHLWNGTPEWGGSRRFRDLLRAGPPRNTQEAIIRGHALLAWLERVQGDVLDERVEKAPQGGSVGLGDKTYRQCIGELLDDLVEVVGRTLPLGAAEARMLVARTFRFDGGRLWDHIALSPLGFRSVRILSEVLRFVAARHWPDGRDAEEVERDCRHLLLRVHEENPSSLYRARAFWEEAAGAAPLTAKWVFLDDLLRERACSGQLGSSPDLLPVRERMYAAQVAFQRFSGFPPGRLEGGAPDAARHFVAEFALAVASIEESGLRYAADYLQSVADGGEPLFFHASLLSKFDVARSSSGSWEELARAARSYRDHDGFWRTRREVQVVTSAIDANSARTALRDLPTAIVPGVRTLVAQACLTIDGLWRRNALETLITAGVRDEAVDVLRLVLERIDAEQAKGGLAANVVVWLREHVVFCIGFLGGDAMRTVMEDELFIDGRASATRPGYRDTRMAALMALGDHAEQLGDRPDALAEKLFKAYDDSRHVAEHRAAMYALATLRPMRPPDRTRLESLRDAPGRDQMVATLAQWAIDRIDAHAASISPCERCCSVPGARREMVPALASARAVPPEAREG